MLSRPWDWIYTPRILIHLINSLFHGQLQGVVHDLAKWREPNWRKKLHLHPEAKEEVAAKVLQTFEEMDKLWNLAISFLQILNHNEMFHVSSLASIFIF